MPTTYGNDIVYCLKSHCGVRGYCRQKWVLQVQIICKFSNERTCKRNKDVQGLSCGFEGKVFYIRIIVCLAKEASRFYYDETAAPPMISSNSLVMACWRVLLYCKVNCWIKSFALSLAVCMAIIRAACSAVEVSSRIV